MKCVDLQQVFGDRYRVGFDCAVEAQPHPANKRDPWYRVIKCKTGAEIYPYGGRKLVVELEGHKNIRRRLDGLACCRIHQLGDDFASYIFDVADFEVVARVVKPYRRRRLTAAKRDELRARLQRNVRQNGPKIASDGKDGPEPSPTKGDPGRPEMPPNSPDSPSPKSDGQESSDTERDRPAA